MEQLEITKQGEAPKQADQVKDAPVDKIEITQAELNRIISERVARERSKYEDYEDLRKFKTEYEKQSEQRQMQELEAQKEYEKLKETWSSRENEYKTLLTQKEQEIQDTKIINALTTEVMKQSAYSDAINLVKPFVFVDKDGQVKYRGKDANGFESEMSVEDGVKQFLEGKPYLVKVQNRQGAGTGSANTLGNAQGNRNLANELIEARKSGNLEKVKEVKALLRAKLYGS